jgi:hypothetical protein
MQTHAAPTRTNVAYNVMAVLLAVGLAMGVALMFLATRGAVSAPVLDMHPAESVDCPFGTGAPVCYRYEIANTGNAAGFVHCEVTPTGDTTALFFNGETVWDSVVELDDGNAMQLDVQVKAGSDDVVTAPSVRCDTT